MCVCGCVSVVFVKKTPHLLPPVFSFHFQTQHKLDVSMLSYDVAILYAFFMNKTKIHDRMKMPYVT